MSNNRMKLNEFCVDEDSQAMCGPWRTEDAAKAAARGDFILANDLEREDIAKSSGA